MGFHPDFFHSTIPNPISQPHSHHQHDDHPSVHIPLPIRKGRSMRFPSIQTLIRGFSIYNLNLTGIRGAFPAAYKGIQTSAFRTTTIRSMPTIPFIGGLFAQKRDMTDYPVTKSEDTWRANLSKEQFRVVRQKGTEAPFTGEYDKHMPNEGTYVCLTIPFSTFLTFVPILFLSIISLTNTHI